MGESPLVVIIRKMYYLLLLLPLSFFYWAYKYRDNVIALVVLAFYALGSLMGFVMTLNPMFKDSLNAGFNDVNIYAIGFILLCFYILFYPILKCSNRFQIKSSIKYNNFVCLSFFTIILSYIYCIYTIPYIDIALNVVDFAEYKADILEKGLDISEGNLILKNLFKFQVRLRPFITFFVFLSLTKIERNKILKFCLLLAALLPPILNSLASAHRNTLFFAISDFFLCFLIFRNQLSVRVRNTFYIIGVLIGLILLYVIVDFAFLRFSDNGGDFVKYSLERYFGEPFVNFNTMLWGTDDYLWGNKCFPEIRKFLGMSFVDPDVIRDTTSNVKYVNYYFYSIVGNFYMDYGPFGSLVLCILIGSLFHYLLNKNLKSDSILYPLIVYLYASFCVHNYFYFEYMAYNNTYIIINILIVIVIYISIGNRLKT